MPINTVEDTLSATADYFERTVQSDAALGNSFQALLEAGKQPSMFRLLDNTIRPGKYMLIIRVQPQP